MNGERRDEILHRFRLAIEMHSAGMAMFRRTLRRRHPDATDDEIEDMVQEWLQDRPMDAPGRVVKIAGA